MRRKRIRNHKGFKAIVKYLERNGFKAVYLGGDNIIAQKEGDKAVKIKNMGEALTLINQEFLTSKKD